MLQVPSFCLASNRHYHGAGERKKEGTRRRAHRENSAGRETAKRSLPDYIIELWKERAGYPDQNHALPAARSSSESGLICIVFCALRRYHPSILSPYFSHHHANGTAPTVTTVLVVFQCTMRLTAVLRAKQRSLKSLALSVHFKQPALGMKNYEILSRATAYLLAVDAKDAEVQDGPYGHLEAAERKREQREYKNLFGRSQPTGPGRNLMEMGWLEFVPREYRPNVHVVCSSHVVAPYLWKDYYPQEWLSQVRREHCTYSLEVYDPEKPQEPQAKLELKSDPYHHPEGRDLALLHFREEKESLKLLKSLGVDILYLRSNDKRFEKDEEVEFDGFVVTERNPADSENFDEQQPQEQRPTDDSNDDSDDDNRIFHPHKETGKLAFHADDRFLATTANPLSEGMCGCPVLDKDGDCCGTVEGIVPLGNPNKQIAGCAAFMPSHVMHLFIEYVERHMLEAMMPKDLFDMVVTAKKTNSIGGGVFKKDPESGKMTGETNWQEEYDRALEKMKERYTPQEYEAIMNTVQRERDEVLEIFDREGGDMADIIKRVRTKTMEMKAMIMDQFEKGQLKLEQYDKKGDKEKAQ